MDAALVPTPKSHRKPTRRLTGPELGLLLRLRDEGLTQVQIAQRLDCDQAAVSRWLHTLTDTTETAKSYLRGQALPIAEKIVRKGRPSDLVKVLQGVSVLDVSEKAGGITINVGGDAQIALLSSGRPTVLSPPDSER